MPRLWDDTIEAHRNAVREAVLRTTAALVAEHGVSGVTMSRIAEATGIGRATLYKYFPDIDAILLAWHEQHVAGHLQQLVEVRDRAGGGARARLEAVLATYALSSRGTGESAVAGALHRGPHMAGAHQQLHAFIQELVAEGVASSELRDDIAPYELASYCLHALGAARTASSKAAVDRLVSVVLAGMETR